MEIQLYPPLTGLKSSNGWILLILHVLYHTLPTPSGLPCSLKYPTSLLLFPGVACSFLTELNYILVLSCVFIYSLAYCLCLLLDCILHEGRAWCANHSCSPSTCWPQVKRPPYICWGNITATLCTISLYLNFKGVIQEMHCFHLNHSKYTGKDF